MILLDTQLTEADSDRIGGKARGLWQLQRLGLPVPSFVVVTVDTVEVLASEDEGGFAQWKDTILSHFVPDALFAVRSSALQEDGTAHSFAGMFQTLLYVRPEELLNALKTIAASAHSERISAYRQQHNLTADAGIAIVIQQMIDAEVAGVAFGANPVSGDKSTKVINSVYGLGEGLVSGRLNADTFEVNDAEIVVSLALKDEQLIRDIAGNFYYVAVPVEKQREASLTETQIREIVAVLDQIEAALKFIPDIEFAYANRQLYVLQARPVTTHLQNSIPEKDKTSHSAAAFKIIWDNSNIVESYPGLTSPLTFSFISKVYEAVYRQLSVVMGIDQSVIDKHSHVYTNMLGHMYGRVYYNLNSWHTALSLLPGYGNNREFMDKMMGTKETFDADVLPDLAQYHTPWRRVKSISRMLKSLLTVEKGRNSFITHFHKIYDQFSKQDYTNRTLVQLRADYQQFEDTLLKEWKAPLVNDLFCMMYFGWLQKQVTKHLGSEASVHVLNDLLSVSRNVITIEPAVQMRRFTEDIRKDLELHSLFSSEAAEVVWEKLKAFHPAFYARLQAYLQQWGHRCMAELKLETISYTMQPSLWIRQIQLLLKANTPTDGLKHAIQQKESAELIMEKALKGKPSQKALFGHVLAKARYFVSNRENLRYERTKAFAVVRQLFLAMGEKLAAQNKLANARDVFYLTQQELFDSIENPDNQDSLNSIVQKRKTQYAAYESVYVPERFTTFGDELPVFENKSATNSQSQKADLKGIAASAGIVQGKVQIVHHPHEVESLDGTILVTVSTDPGWVVLFPGCKGILVERGSLLSHAAIVSREMGIPCIVGIPSLTQQLKTGDEISMNGATGEIKILDS